MCESEQRQAGTSEFEITPAMVAAGAREFARRLPDVEEVLKNSETAVLVEAICTAALSQVGGRIQVYKL